MFESDSVPPTDKPAWTPWTVVAQYMYNLSYVYSQFHDTQCYVIRTAAKLSLWVAG